MQSQVSPDMLAALGIECVRPNDTQRDELGRIIMQELVYGDVQPSSIRYCQGLIQTFQQQGCDAAVLGCTEIPLIIQDGNAALPSLDSTRLLARAALRHAVGSGDYR